MNKKNLILKNKKIVLFLIVLIFSISIYFLDLHFRGKIFDFISNNALSKITTIFLTVAGLIGLFYPFNLKKDISEKDISEISRKTIEQDTKERERNKRIEERSKF